MAVIIRPEKGSKKFYKNAKQFQRVVDVGTGQATGDYAAAGEYSGERFPNSKQRPRIRFSYSKRRWLLYRSDGEEYTEEELNSLVEKAHLTHWKGNKKGEYITTADVTNLSDAFFNHPHLSALLKEGSATLAVETSTQEKLLASGLRGHRQFREANEKATGINSASVKYVITDKDTDISAAKETRDKTLEAVRLFDALNDRKRAMVARILGLRVRKDTDRAVIDDSLFKMVMDNKTFVKDTTTTPQQMFIELCEANQDDLALRDLVARAKVGGIIRKTKEGWKFRGVKVGRTLGAMEQHFKSPENQEALLALEQSLEDVDK